MPISLYEVLGAGHMQFGIWREFLMPIPLYLVLCAGRAQFGIWQEFLMSISLYVVFGAGRAQFGILGGVSIAYLTLCISQSGPRMILAGVSNAYPTFCCLCTQSGPSVIWDFGGVMLSSERAAPILGFWRKFL